MRRPVVRILPWAAGVLLLLSACEGKDVAGIPSVPPATASEPSQSAGESEVPGFGAPKIENPLDVGGLDQRPCEALTDAQVTELLGSDTTKKEENVSGPMCSWHSYGTDGAFVAVSFPTVTDLGLTGLYRGKGQQLKFFKEMSPVRGYPTVAWGQTDDTATDGRCGVSAGTTDRTTLDATVTLSKKNVGTKDPCEAARGVLDLVIGNIQGGR
ncbi:DUF3558 domain-containing protein [Amycolatopsis magusensis]|uniref:DUF3558 domain-containing protein n=1 Tax=Amycolatopsis magusensis TaxID=882444 RepID=UPI0024A818BD|nr:DUF3558 domain-containing protein [Amycolatopsis magusensis]MDI5977805.1 DUF3558 domain-containing protein [Amycolatopsis magusensis]